MDKKPKQEAGTISINNEPTLLKEKKEDTSRTSNQGRKAASGGTPESTTRVNRRSPKSPK